MKLLIRLVFAAALLGASLATPAAAQYMFLDVNGDAIHTDADDLLANGSPTTATLYVTTNQNRDGSTALCNAEPDTALTINSYVVNLQAVGGTVLFSNFTNLQAGMVTNFGEVNPDSVIYKNGYGGAVALDPGKYALATITLTGLSGSPSIEIVDQVPGSPDFTSFGSRCVGNDFDNTYKLTGQAGGTDWTDVDGLGQGPGGNAFPTLDFPLEVVGSIGTPINILATATDEDPTDMLTITYSSTAPFLSNFVHVPSVSPATATLSGTPGELTQGNYQVSWSVSDGQNDPVTGVTTVIVTEGGGPNDCPVLTPIGPLTATEGELLTFNAVATDADPGQTWEFSLGAGAPDGANINGESGLFTWTPTEEQSPGEYSIVFRVTDNGSPACTDSETVVVTVNEVGGGNQCPVLTPLGNKTVNEGVLLTFAVTATDADAGQTLTFSMSEGAPTGSTFDPNTGIFNWTPTEDQSPGVFPVTLHVIDNGTPACADSETIEITVNEVGDNTCPELAAIGNQTVDEGTLLSFNVTATDPDVGQALTFTLDPGFPEGAAVDPNTGVFTFTPSEAQGPGEHTVTIRVTDNADPACSDFELITITVNEVGGKNQCPVLAAIGNQDVDELSLLTFTALATDPDAGQTLTFSLDAGFPTGASIDPVTGVFTFTPTADQGPGTYTVTVRVSDDADPICSDFETITVTVNGGPGENQCPVITPIADMTVTEGQLLTFTATATDADAGQTITFSLVNLIPDGAAIDANTGVFTWTPSASQGPGGYDVSIQATDNAATPCSVTEILHVIVNDTGGENACPVIAPIADMTVTEGQLLTFTATATDADAGQTITFSLVNLIPDGAAIDANTGVFTWTPSASQGPGGYDVSVQATDNAATPCSVTEILHVIVNDTGGENACPVIAPIADMTATEGQLLTFTATATDADAGQTITFSLVNLIPDGAAIDANTGVFTWTPSASQGPGGYDVSVQATDNAATPCSVTEILHVIVNDAGGENACPVIAPIADMTVTEGQLLTFTATATDADGDEITFSLVNLIPDGAAIDANTGVFTWTPSASQGPGGYDVSVQATDNASTPCSVTEILHVIVNDAGGGENQCPVINPIAGQTVDEGQTVTFTVTATDPENETLVFALGPGAPAGAQIHPLSGVFTWTPTNDQAGTHTITFQVRDTCEDPCTVTATVVIVVNETEPENQCPVLSSIGNQTVEEEVLLTFDANATDPDVGQTLTFSLDPGFPTGASINSSTGEFTFTPTHDQVGTHSVTVRVTDDADPACSDFETITITVEEGVNECPVLATIGDKTVTEGELLTFTATATDEENDEIIFSLDEGAPAGASIHANTGVFTWTPTSEQGPGTFDITIRATDLCDSPCSDTETIQVTVIDAAGANECPVLAPVGDRTVNEGSLLTFTATATDEDEEEIIFSLDEGAPNGALIHANTGVFTWTPTPSQGPGTYDITIRATDLCDTPCSDTETIQVTVLDGSGGGGDNECPVLATIGNMTATQGENLAFTATATDPDPGQVTFALVGAPSGATIHEVTGAFLWVPSETGTVSFAVKVTDPEGCSDEETIEVTVNPVGGGGASTVTAYFVGGNKTTKLWTGKKETCIQLEVTGNDQIDFSTIELVYNGQRIAAKGGERSRDRDRDGNPEGTVCFSKQELRTLFAGLPSGENLVAIQIVGRFESGESFTASVSHRIDVRGGNNGHDDEAEDEEDDGVVAGNGNARMKAHAAPNPINPSTLLKFGVTQEGPVKVQVYDLSGRLVRTLHDGTLPAGNNAVAWDGTRNGGDRVSSGVYYFRIQSRDGQDVVRVTVLK